MSSPAADEGPDSWALFLNGTYGVGKSTVLDHVGDALHSHGTPFCLMDVDWFHRSWPPADDDPTNTRTEAQNMADVWRNHRRAGPRRLVVSGVVATPADRERYERALGMPLRTVRLTATVTTRTARLRARYDASRTAAADWHLARHSHLAATLDAADLDDHVVATDDRTPAAVASSVLRAVHLTL